MARKRKRGNGLAVGWSSGGKRGPGAGIVPSAYSGKRKKNRVKLLLSIWGKKRGRRKDVGSLSKGGAWDPRVARKNKLLRLFGARGRKKNQPGSLAAIGLSLAGGKRRGRKGGDILSRVILMFSRLINRQMDEPPPISEVSASVTPPQSPDMTLPPQPIAPRENRLLAQLRLRWSQLRNALSL